MEWHGREIQLLRHRYNCQINDPAYPPLFGRLGKWLLDWRHRRHGVPTGAMRSSERAVEIPLAVDFLASAVKGEDVVELGCVLPYYLLKRANHRVFDLMDPHPECERRDVRTLSDAELSVNVVSVSTVEHVGLADYGIGAAHGSRCEAAELLSRVVKLSKRCFVTFPLGHNPGLDAFVLGASGLGARYLTRRADDPERWREVDGRDLAGDMLRENTYCRANTVCVVEKLG